MVGFYLVDNTEKPHIYKLYKYLTFSLLASVPKQMLKDSEEGMKSSFQQNQIFISKINVNSEHQEE